MDPKGQPQAETQNIQATSPATASSSLDDSTQSDTEDPVQDNKTIYITNTGGSMIELLEEIIANTTLSEYVARQMHMPLPEFQQNLTQLMNKIDQGNVTAIDLALIMSAPLADDIPR